MDADANCLSTNDTWISLAFMLGIRIGIMYIRHLAVHSSV